MFDMGDRVVTPYGSGRVRSRRMLGPTYTEVASYSILLDEKVEATKHPPFPNYSGTVVPAQDVKAG